MTNYPDLNDNKNELSFVPKDNSQTISDSYSSLKKKGNSIINNALNKKVSEIKSEISKVPETYKNIRNNLTVKNNKIKKNTEEYIANTGNHTASGYAMSKRMNNNNEYLKELNNIDISEKSKLSELNSQLRSAYSDAENEKLKLSAEYDYKLLQDKLKESERTDRLNYDIEKFNSDRKLDYEKLAEERKLNDSKIKKTENDIRLDNEENERKSAKHNMEMEYEPLLYQSKIDNEKMDINLTQAKINKTNAETNKIKTQSSSKKTSSSPTSKISAKDLAQSIEKQASEEYYDVEGKLRYNMDELKAYGLLIGWKNKFGLSQQVVNDAAIHLGIQSYL